MSKYTVERDGDKLKLLKSGNRRASKTWKCPPKDLVDESVWIYYFLDGITDQIVYNTGVEFEVEDSEVFKDKTLGLLDSINIQ